MTSNFLGVARAVNFCIKNLDWVREDGGKEGTHEWIVLRTGSHDAFLRHTN